MGRDGRRALLHGRVVRGPQARSVLFLQEREGRGRRVSRKRHPYDRGARVGEGLRAAHLRRRGGRAGRRPRRAGTSRVRRLPVRKIRAAGRARADLARARGPSISPETIPGARIHTKDGIRSIPAGRSGATSTSILSRRSAARRTGRTSPRCGSASRSSRSTASRSRSGSTRCGRPSRLPSGASTSLFGAGSYRGTLSLMKLSGTLNKYLSAYVLWEALLPGDYYSPGATRLISCAGRSCSSTSGPRGARGRPRRPASKGVVHGTVQFSVDDVHGVRRDRRERRRRARLGAPRGRKRPAAVDGRTRGKP